MRLRTNTLAGLHIKLLGWLQFLAWTTFILWAIHITDRLTFKTGIISIVVVLSVLALGLYVQFAGTGFFCPSCDRFLETNDWTCGHCDNKNYPIWKFLHSCVHKCSKCRRTPPGVQCYHCGSVIGKKPNFAVLRPIAITDKALVYKQGLEDEWDLLRIKLESSVNRFQELSQFQQEQLKRLRSLVTQGKITEEDYELFEANLQDFIIMKRDL